MNDASGNSTVGNNLYVTTNAGIGTTSPGALLEVSAANASVYSAIRMTNTTASGTTPGAGIEWARAGTVKSSITANTYGNDYMAFNVNGNTERMRIGTSGDIGIGVVPTTTQLATIQSTYGALTGNSEVNIAGNAYYNAGWKYVGTGLATQYRQSAGVHTWSTAVTGTAGNTISFAESMRIDTSGNVGIGGTPSYKLDVQQNGNFNATIGVSNTTAGTSSVARLIAISDAGNASFGFTSSSYTDITGAQDALLLNASNASGGMAFALDGVVKMKMDSSGNLLVGATATSSSSRFYSVNSAGIAGVFYNSAASQQSIAALRIDKADNTTTTAQVFAQFTINAQATGSGQINANGANAAAFGTYSDKRLKENIVELPSQLANICALRPVEFDFIASEGGGHQIGFIAQEVNEIYPDLVGEREDGMFTLSDMNKNDARLIKAIQELKAQNDALTARVAALEAK